MKRLNWIGIFVTSLAIGFIVYVNTIMIIGPSEKVDTTEKPISQDSILGKCLEGVVHWEVWNDTLLIYTEEDSIRDDERRWEYIQWIENEYEEEEWEQYKWEQGVCEGDTLIVIETPKFSKEEQAYYDSLFMESKDFEFIIEVDEEGISWKVYPDGSMELDD